MAQPARLVRVEDRVKPEGVLTPGMHREQAIASDGIWVGTVRTEPGVLSGWHHHGGYETYIYVLYGTARLDYAVEGEVASLEARPGDFIHLSPGVVHREGSAGPGVEAVLLRIGEGQVVFEADDPEAAAATEGRESPI